jgi:aconitate hydratase
MTVKLLGSREEGQSSSAQLSVAVDQVALVLTSAAQYGEHIGQIERAHGLDLVVAYDPYCIRSAVDRRDPDPSRELRRLGILHGRPGIGYPGAVHLERCAAPTRVLVTDSPHMVMLGGLGMLTLCLPPRLVLETIATGRVTWRSPEVIQVILSGRLNASVSARDVTLELMRRGLAERVSAIAQASQSDVVLEFSGPGARSMSVPERALLCSMASEVGAASAIAACDEKTEQFLRDQRRSKAFRQLTPDAGAPCAEAICLDLSSVLPLIALASGSIVPVSDVVNSPVKEVFIGGETSGALRDLLNAAAWFKTKRIAADVDVVIVPATRQALEAMVVHGTFAQLLSSGARLLEPDARLLSTEFAGLPSDGLGLRSAPYHAGSNGLSAQSNVASLDTLCASAMAGVLTDPRSARKTQRVVFPRELPIDDGLLFDKKPAPSLSAPPPPREPRCAWSDQSDDCPTTDGCALETAQARRRMTALRLDGPS